MSENVKVAKRGEIIAKEGDKISSLILIQSGSGMMCLNRNKKNVEIFSIGPSQIFGEQAFSGATTHNFSLVSSASETKYMEMPIETAKAQVEAAPQLVKLFLKSVVDRLKLALADVKSIRLDKDSAPCPEDQVAKIFGSIYHAAKHKAQVEEAKKGSSALSMEWVAFKQYCQRIFGESPRRIEQATNLLVKLKMCTYVMGKPIDNPDGPDEIQKIIFLDLGSIESFFEFYQYYYFKGGNASIIKFDESSYNLLANFLKLAVGSTPDRMGAVSFELSKAIEYFKNELGINLNSAHFTQLENKGIFAKRHTKADGNVVLSFDLKEWETVQKSWKIISEIDKWNEKGFVDMNEEEKPKKKSGFPSCKTCGAEIVANAKFCQECGTKVEAP
jgi:hypothetical protein